MQYLSDNNNIKLGSSFLQASDWLALIVMALVGTYINSISYNNTLSILIQASLLGLIFIFYRQRPVMMMVAYIMLTILPIRMLGGFSESGAGLYTLNPRICLVFACLFLIYGFIVLQRRYKINLLTLLFVLFMIFSLTWTVSDRSYDAILWWMCAAYLIWPLFVTEDRDVRLVLTSYIVAVDIFCINVLPKLLDTSGPNRGTVSLDPNYAAFFVIVSVAVIFSMLVQYKAHLTKTMQIFLWASGILAVITQAYFASRTAFVMLAFLVVAFILFNTKRLRTILLTLVGIAGVYFVLNQYGVFDTVLLRFTEANTLTGGGRLPIQMELLKSAYEGDLGRFFFGNGFLTADKFGLGMQAHNSYVSILIGFGMIGLIIYMAYLIDMYKALRSSFYKPFLIVFLFLCLYSLSLEPYHMIEGITFFCLLSGISNLAASPSLQNDQLGPSEGE